MGTIAESYSAELAARKAEVEQLTKKVKRAHIEDPVKLDVGGHKFTTSTATLRSVDGSMLSAMFSGRFPLKPHTDGHFHIDRNGEHFGKILDYLRDRHLAVPKDDEGRARLLRELDFFGLTDAKRILDPPPPPNYGSSIASGE